MINELQQAKQLYKDTSNIHKNLVEHARLTAEFQKILEFIVECIEFAQNHISNRETDQWKQVTQYIPVLSERTYLVLGVLHDNPYNVFSALESTGGTIATGTFSYLTDNFNNFEDSRSRSGYMYLASKYQTLLSSPSQKRDADDFLGLVNGTAQIKFGQSLKDFQTLPEDEDPQGPLLAMRSAIDLTLESLLKLTPLTRDERGDLKRISELPTIAQHLARDENAKLNLILVNEQLNKLKGQLSASKNQTIPRIQAEGLMNQSVALLRLISANIKLPSEQVNEG
jgi:hypothetical protein